VWCSVLQCVAVCCGVLQCVAVCCSVLQCVAECHRRHPVTMQLNSPNSSQLVANTIMHSYIYIYIYVCVCVCMYLCVCVCMCGVYIHKYMYVCFITPHYRLKSPGALIRMISIITV